MDGELDATGGRSFGVDRAEADARSDRGGVAPAGEATRRDRQRGQSREGATRSHGRILPRAASDRRDLEALTHSVTSRYARDMRTSTRVVMFASLVLATVVVAWERSPVARAD